MNKSTVGILLAAGQSTRFGSNKLLHPITDNTPMVLVSAQKLAAALEHTIIVINKELIAFSSQIEQLGMRVVMNEQAHLGMGSSIACAVGASEDATGWLIGLADMPYIKTETIALLSRRLSAGADIVAPMYKQKRGHPVGFSHRYKHELMRLNNDIGARDILASHQDQLDLIHTQDEGVIIDIDINGQGIEQYDHS